MSDIHNATPKQDELTEEEFIELVLEEQQEALAQAREERIYGKKPKTKASCTLDRVGYGTSAVFNTFALIFQIYSIPALEFIKVSTRLSAQRIYKPIKRQSLKFLQAQ